MTHSHASAKLGAVVLRRSAAGVAATTGEFAVLEGHPAGLGEGGVRVGAQAEVAALAAYGAPPDPMLGPRRADAADQAALVAVLAGQCDAFDERRGQLPHRLAVPLSTPRSVPGVEPAFCGTRSGVEPRYPRFVPQYLRDHPERQGASRHEKRTSTCTFAGCMGTSGNRVVTRNGACRGRGGGFCVTPRVDSRARLRCRCGASRRRGRRAGRAGGTRRGGSSRRWLIWRCRRWRRLRVVGRSRGVIAARGAWFGVSVPVLWCLGAWRLECLWGVHASVIQL